MIGMLNYVSIIIIKIILFLTVLNQYKLITKIVKTNHCSKFQANNKYIKI